MIDVEKPSHEEFSIKKPFEPLDVLGWHRILPGEQIEIIECRQFNDRVWLALSSQACLAGFGHYLRVIDIVKEGAETYFVLDLHPDSEIAGPDSWPRTLLARLTGDNQLYALSDRAFEEVEDSISKSLDNPGDVLTKAIEIFDSNVLKWNSDHVLTACPYEPEEGEDA